MTRNGPKPVSSEAAVHDDDAAGLEKLGHCLRIHRIITFYARTPGNRNRWRSCRRMKLSGTKTCRPLNASTRAGSKRPAGAFERRDRARDR